MLEHFKSGKLGEFEIFYTYLPKHLPVLEAGCGLGQLVMALDAREYQVEGIDYALQTINRIKEYAPQLNVAQGDIYHINKPDGYYGGYISMGVLEHNPEGPVEGLLEARRVLHPEGVAFVTVPYLNRKRRKLITQVKEASTSPFDFGLHFYQYYFSVEEFTSLLHQAGFELVEIYPYAVFAGLTRDYGIGKWLLKNHFYHWRLQSIFTKWCENAPNWARRSYAHMVMFVCRPRNKI